MRPAQVAFLDPVVPEQPSQRVMWTVRRGIDAAFKVPNRLSVRAQNTVHDFAVSGLLAVSTFFDILQDVIIAQF